MRITLALLLAVGCKEVDSAPAPIVTAVPAAPQVSAAPQLPAPSVSAAAQPDMVNVSAALFKGDDLIGCVDLVTAKTSALEEAAKPTGMTPKALLAEDLTTYLGGGKSLIGRVLDKALTPEKAKSLKPAGKPEVVPKACEEQFAGRVLISRCTVGTGDDKLRIGIEFQSFDATVPSDRAMRSCFAAQGDWWELPRDTLQFKSEHAKQQLRDLQR